MVIMADGVSARGDAAGQSRAKGALAQLGRAANALRRGETNVGNMERVASVAGGVALALYGIRRRDAVGGVLGLVGAMMLHRGATGHCMVYNALDVSTAEEHGFLEQQHGKAAVLDAQKAVKVEHTVTIDRPRQELYTLWRNFENLPRIMGHLERVEVLDERRSRWTAKAPAGQTVQWEAEIHNEIPGSLIAWRSVNEATVPNAGSVHFRDAANGGTELQVVLEYQPPAGKLGSAVSKLFHEEPDRQVREDLQRFKQAMESGTAATEGRASEA